MSSTNYQVYFLTDPSSKHVFYVGIGNPGRATAHTAYVRNRLVAGRSLDPRNTRHQYIAELLHRGIEPLVTIEHDKISKGDAKRLEIEYIALFGREDLGRGKLKNRTSGGEWIVDCPRNALWLERMSASAKIAQNRPEVKAAKSAKLKGQKRSKEQIERIRQSQLVIREMTSQKRRGDANPNAKRIRIDGVEYGSFVEAAKVLTPGKPWQLRRKFRIEEL